MWFWFSLCLQIIPGCHLSPASCNCNSGGNLAKPNQQIFRAGIYYQVVPSKCQTRMSLCQDLPCQQKKRSSFENKSQFQKISQTTMRGLNLIQHFSTPVSWNAWYWIWFIKRVTTVEFLVDNTCVFWEGVRKKVRKFMVFYHTKFFVWNQV